MSAEEVSEKRKWVRLTRACNNKCIFCLDEEAQNGTALSFSEIILDLKKGLETGAARAVISGGDPTVHPEFLKIVRSASILGYKHIQVITNGRMFCYKDFLQEAVHNGMSELTVSFHAPKPEINDYLTGIKGSFAQSLAALRNALKFPHLIVNCDVVVNRLNVDLLAEHISMLHAIGICEFDLLHIMPFGRAWKNWNKLYYDPYKKKRQLFKAFNMGKSSKMHLWTNRFPAGLFEGHEYLIQNPDKLTDEIFGRRFSFEALRKGMVEMSCSGLRCKYCVLQNFCADFKQLIKDGFLPAYPQPKCLGGLPDECLAKSDMPLMDFAKFYIKRRHFIKSKRCKTCYLNPVCKGTSVNRVRSEGFSCMKPLAK